MELLSDDPRTKSIREIAAKKNALEYFYKAVQLRQFVVIYFEIVDVFFAASRDDTHQFTNGRSFNNTSVICTSSLLDTKDLLEGKNI